MSEPAMQTEPTDPDSPSRLIFEGISQAVAHAMVPMRQEITAGLHETNRNLKKLDERVERVETDVAEIKTTLARIEGKLG